jgi:tetratricopeptide (TPR) repeat protein
MNYRERVFTVFETGERGEESKVPVREGLYTYENPFDFFRETVSKDRYMPKTQRGLRKAFSEGLIGIEFYIEMATSLRPLDDEAQDLDEITRLFSQQKLSLRPTPHSVSILRNMIKDPNPEIALYAAEGLNTIENSYIQKIQKLKEKLKKGEGVEEVLLYNLGILYLRFVKLLEGQKLIQSFYLRESLTNLEKANKINSSNPRILKPIGEVYMMLGEFNKALRIFRFLFSENENDMESLMMIARCYFSTGDFDKIREIFSKYGGKLQGLDDTSEMIVYQWIV